MYLLLVILITNIFLCIPSISFDFVLLVSRLFRNYVVQSYQRYPYVSRINALVCTKNIPSVNAYVCVFSRSPDQKACPNYDVVWARIDLLIYPGSNLGQWPIQPYTLGAHPALS